MSFQAITNRNHQKKTSPDDFEQFSFQKIDESPSFRGNSSSNLQSLHSSQNRNNPPFSNNTFNPSNQRDHDDSYHSKGSNSKKNTSTSVIVHIKLGENLTKEIKCDLDDDILVLAQDFCKENNLAAQAVPIIINMIKQQFSVILQRMRENGKSNDEHNSFEGNKSLKSPHFKETEKSFPQPNGHITERETESEKTDNSFQRSKLVGKLDVAISPSETKELKLYEEEDPVDVAYKFCKGNNLPLSIVEVLAEKLEKLRKSYVQKKNKQAREGYKAPMRTEVRQTFGRKNKSFQDDSPEEVMQDTKRELSPLPTQNKNPFQLEPNNSKNQPMGSPNFFKQNPPPDVYEENETSYLDIPSLEELKEEKEEKSVKQKEPPMSAREARDENSTAQSYEKWANLIKDKNKMKMMISPSITNTSCNKGQGKFAKEERSLEPQRSNNAPKEAFTLGSRTPKFIPGGNIKTMGDMASVSPRGSSRNKDDNLHRLYFEGIANKAYKEKKMNEALNKKKQEEDKELTFQPNIDRKSPKKTGRDKSPVYNQNYKEHKERVHRIEENHTQNFPFRPKISAVSYELAKKRESRSPIHRKLYDEGLSAKEQNEKAREAVIKDRHPFKPHIPKSNDSLLTNRPKENQKEFTERLLNEGKMKEEKLVKQRAQERTGLDPKTGQKLFQPMIPHDEYYKKVKQLDDEKYNKSRSRSRTPRNGESSQASSSTFREKEIKTNSHNSHHSHHSYHNSGQNHENVLRNIFDQLDSDHDGYISAQNIDLSQLDTRVLETLLDFMDFLENNQAPVDFNGFMLAISGLDLEEKVIKAMHQESSLNLSPKRDSPHSHYQPLFPQHEEIEEHMGPSGRPLEEERELYNHKVLNKNPSKKSDFSTASSNITDNSSNKITKHYREILEKKAGRKII